MKKKVIILIILLTGFYLLWIVGGDWVYGLTIKSLLKLLSSIIGGFDLTLLEKSGCPVIVIGKYNQNAVEQSMEIVSLPFVVLFSWQLFLFTQIPAKKALKVSSTNIGIFLVLQVVFFYLLLSYQTNLFSGILFNLLLHGFGVIVIVLIIKDNILQKGIFYQPEKIEK